MAGSLMAKPILDEALWAVLELLLPLDPPRPRGGRPRLPHRQVLTGILFVLRSGIPWELLPKERGCGSGMTCWRRLQEWQAKGLWQRIHHELLNWLGQIGHLDWSRASLDSASVPAKRGGALSGPNPTDRGKAGTKRHVVVDRQGIPLAVKVTAANEHDGLVFEPLLGAIPPIQGRFGRPRRRPEKLHADKAYDARHCRTYLRKRGIKSRIARRGLESSERLGRHRWVVERTLAWLNRFRRLAIRYERRADIHEALVQLGCILICWNFIHLKGFC
jgi:transposase